MILYKYTTINKYVDDTIIKRNIFFNNPQNFNDPFDCNFILETDCSAHEKSDYISINMRKAGRPEPEIEQAITKAKNNNEFWNRMIQEGKDKFINNIGVCCFSKTDENPLLWAHYTNKHEGICLVFETDNDKNFFDKFFEIKYRSNYPKINFIKDRKRFDELVLTKSIDWIYEQEVRVLKDIGPKTYQFDKPALVGVIFGCKTSSSEIIRIKDLLLKNGYSISIKQAILRQGSFGLNFENI